MNLNATILGQTIAFIIFVFFCMKYIWPPLIAAIEKRQKEIADSLTSIEYAKKKLDITQAEAINCLKQAKIEAQEIIKKANKYKEQLIDEAKSEAKEERKKILAQAQVEIDVELRRAREELRKHISVLALAGVEKIIERSIDESANNDIIDKIIAKL